MNIDTLFQEYNKINEDDHDSIVEFVDKNYSLILNIKSSELSEIEDCTTILKDYFYSLFEIGRYSEILKKEEEVCNFLLQFKNESSLLTRNYIEIEFNYILALIETGKNLKIAIAKLKELKKLDPKNENVEFLLRDTSFMIRNQYYKTIIVIGLVIGLIGILFRFFKDDFIFHFMDTVGISLFIIFFVIQFIDRKISERMPNR